MLNKKILVLFLIILDFYIKNYFEKINKAENIKLEKVAVIRVLQMSNSMEG